MPSDGAQRSQDGILDAIAVLMGTESYRDAPEAVQAIIRLHIRLALNYPN